MLADAEPPRRLATVVVIGKLNQGVNLRFRCNKRANENRYVFAFGGRIHATPISVLEVMTYRIFLAGTVGPFEKFVDLRLGQIIVREDGGEHPLMHGGDEWTAGDFAVVGVCVIASLEQRFVEGEQFVIVGNLEHLERLASANGRFLRHRPKRSERCLDYGNYTKASPRCQRWKVCPKGLSVKTMLCGGPSVVVQGFVEKLTIKEFVSALH